MFERSLKLIDINLLNKIKETNVLIVGLGGVGGCALETLARLGIENFILIDNDIFSLSNLNRQILSNKENIGKLKTKEGKKRVLQINNDINCEIINEFLTKDNINTLDNYKIDYIIDACDTITTKVELIKYSQEKKIKLITCLGTGNRFNPSKLEITTLNKTDYDPVAKILRKLCKENEMNLNIPVIWSREVPIKTGDRTPGSLVFVPNAAGILCANYIFNQVKTSIK